MRARVQAQVGRAITGAEVGIWHASPVGFYENQDPEQAQMNLRGNFTTGPDDRFWFRSVRMVGHPIPNDGVVGRLLREQDRHRDHRRARGRAALLQCGQWLSRLRSGHLWARLNLRPEFSEPARRAASFCAAINTEKC